MPYNCAQSCISAACLAFVPKVGLLVSQACAPSHLFPRWGHYEVIHLQAEIPTRHGMIGRTMAHARESKHSMQATHRAADRLAQLLPQPLGHPGLVWLPALMNGG